MDTPILIGLPPVLVMPTDELPPNVNAELRFMDTEELLLRYRDRNGMVGRKFISPQDAKAAFNGVELDTGWIPNGVHRFGNTRSGWWFVFILPPHREDITLIGGKSGEVISVPLPTMVMVGSGGHYNVWAMRGNVLDPEAKLYRAPLPNVAPNDGGICWGGNSMPEVHPDNARKAWDLFIRSPFNNHHIDAKSRMFPGDVREQLKKISESGKKAYPVRDLVQVDGYSGTLDKVIKAIVR